MRRLATLLCIVNLSIVAVLSARYALADFYFDRAKRTFNTLNVSQLDYSYELDSLIADINRSLNIRRASANSLDLKADLLYQSWWLSPDGQYFQQSKLLQTAADLHIEASNLRNDWAFSVARLALIYSHQANLDENFAQWFLESHRLGLYETSIARSLMTIGLQNWEQLSVSQKRLTIDFARTSIEQKVNSPQMMILILDRYRRRNEVCNSLPDTPRKIKVCQG